jgi:hypothetical protein
MEENPDVIAARKRKAEADEEFEKALEEARARLETAMILRELKRRDAER